MLAIGKELWVPLFGYLLFFDSQVALTHRYSQIGSPLEDFDMASFWPPSLSDLHASRASADDGTLLALDRDLFIRPEGGVMENTFELVDAWPVGHIALRCEASADNEVLRFGIAIICSLDVPASLIGLELSFGDNTFESCIFLEVEDLVAGVEIVSQVVIVGIVVWPVVSKTCQQSSHPRPRYNARFDNLGNVQLVLGDFRVDHGSS